MTATVAWPPVTTMGSNAGHPKLLLRPASDVPQTRRPVGRVVQRPGRGLSRETPASTRTARRPAPSAQDPQHVQLLPVRNSV